jgi:hypothetical protein
MKILSVLKESVETRTIVLNYFNIQCTSRYNKVKMKVMHGINMDKLNARQAKLCKEERRWSTSVLTSVLKNFK